MRCNVTIDEDGRISIILPAIDDFHSESAKFIEEVRRFRNRKLEAINFDSYQRVLIELKEGDEMFTSSA